MTREELEQGRYRGHKKYGYFWSFCEQNKCCEDCDKLVRIGCVLKRKIEDIQTKRILKICKPDPWKGEEGMNDWFGILLTILSIFIGGFALGYKCGEEKKDDSISD